MEGLKIQILSATWDLCNGEESEQNLVQLIDAVHEFKARARSLTSKGPSNFEILAVSVSTTSKNGENGSEIISNEAEVSEMNAATP